MRYKGGLSLCLQFFPKIKVEVKRLEKYRIPCGILRGILKDY
ncbi:hypothetical protein [Helicobacter ganmani]